MQLLIAAAVLAALQFPQCEQERPLTPEQVTISTVFDAEHHKPLTPQIENVIFTINDRLEPAWADDTYRLVRDLREAGCGPRLVVSGMPKSRKFLLTSEKLWIFSEYEFLVEQVYRNGTSTPITVGSTIKVVRDGGVICTPSGSPLRVLDTDKDFLKVGLRHLLFLEPLPGGYYRSSSYDWQLYERAIRAKAGAKDTGLLSATLLSHVGSLQCE